MPAEPPPARLLSLLRLPVSPRPTALPGVQAGEGSGWLLKISCAASSLLFKQSQCLCFFLLHLSRDRGEKMKVLAFIELPLCAGCSSGPLIGSFQEDIAVLIFT